MKVSHFFSVNGPQSSELNIDFIGSFSHSVRDDGARLLKNHVRMSHRRGTHGQGKEDEGRRESEPREFRTKETADWEADFKRMTVKRVKGDRQGQGRDKGNTGGMRRKNKEFRKQQLRVEGWRGRKTQRWMRQGSHRTAKGRESFFLLKRCDQNSLLFPSLSNTCHSSSPWKSLLYPLSLPSSLTPKRQQLGVRHTGPWPSSSSRTDLDLRSGSGCSLLSINEALFVEHLSNN